MNENNTNNTNDTNDHDLYSMSRRSKKHGALVTEHDGCVNDNLPDDYEENKESTQKHPSVAKLPAVADQLKDPPQSTRNELSADADKALEDEALQAPQERELLDIEQPEQPEHASAAQLLAELAQSAGGVQPAGLDQSSDADQFTFTGHLLTVNQPQEAESLPERVAVPVIADQPTAAKQATVSSQPTVADQPTAVEQTMVSAQSAVTAQLPAVEQSTISTQTAVADRPTVITYAAPSLSEVLFRRPAVGMAMARRIRINRLHIRKRRHERHNHGQGRSLFIAAVVLFSIVSSLVYGSVGAAYAYYQSQLPLLNGIAQHSLFQTTRIYDRNGKLLYELYDHQQDRGRRTYINYSDISPYLVQATVATEDHTFWTNTGVDYYGIIRAALANLQHHSVLEGGSTVTEQLIKNQFFSDQPRTFQVKTEEAILASGLTQQTQQYPKWKIMEMYLNTVYYGDLNYGVEAAAESYFQLPERCTGTTCIPAVKQLDLAQSSLLAGLPQSPSVYDPTIHKDAAMKRQKFVLDSMHQLGMITQKQEDQAIQETAKYVFKPYSETHHILAPHFVHYVIDEVLVPLLGAQNILDGGYNVYTTLDLDLEQKVEQIVYNHLYQPQQDSYLGDYGPLYETNNVNNGAAVVMNPLNGEILAMDGSADYNNNTNPQMQGEYDSALALRQPGSSFKPIVYATAFEMGWYPGMIVPDHQTIYPGNLTPPYYMPQNYDGTFHTGFPMTIRTAVANSYNIPAIDALEFAGIPNVLNMAARLGLDEVASRPVNELGPAMAIGSTEVSLLHMTQAYATFANRGVRVPPTSILAITDNQGRPIYNFDPDHPHGVRAMREDVAYLIDSILADKQARYHEFYPGNPLELDRPAAAKTGTTDSFRDNWTMGYTPYLTVGVWAGNSDNSIMQNVIGITGAGPIWHDIMEYASHRYNFPGSDFVRPSDVHQGQVSAYTGLQPHPGESTVTDWFIDGALPTIQGDYYYDAPPTKCQGQCKPVSTCHGKHCEHEHDH